MIPFAVVLACTMDCGIGKDGALPWYLPPDLRRFREITSSTMDLHKRNAIIMGRKTWESLPMKPLPNRCNIVITSRPDEILEHGVTCVSSLEEALSYVHAHRQTIEYSFVIGGSRLFREAMLHPFCETVYVTMINYPFACDTFFEKDALTLFTLEEISEEKKYRNIVYKFAVFTKRTQ